MGSNAGTPLADATELGLFSASLRRPWPPWLPLLPPRSAHCLAGIRGLKMRGHRRSREGQNYRHRGLELGLLGWPGQAGASPHPLQQATWAHNPPLTHTSQPAPEADARGRDGGSKGLCGFSKVPQLVLSSREPGSFCSPSLLLTGADSELLGKRKGHETLGW